MLKKQQNSSKDLIGIDEITDYSIKTKYGELVYFMIKPSNLSVLSEDSVSSRVHSLMTILKGISDVEMICMNSKENFDENKQYIKKRIEDEPNQIVRKLLELDNKNLDKIQVTMATAREFLIVIRLVNEKENDILSYLARIEKSFKDAGFSLKRANQEDIQRILSVYFEQNVTTEKYEDYDGERWVI
ncbi:MAG: hypothetical protein R3Y35_11910 [Clostridia bacterium]